MCIIVEVIGIGNGLRNETNRSLITPSSCLSVIDIRMYAWFCQHLVRFSTILDLLRLNNIISHEETEKSHLVIQYTNPDKSK